MMFEKLIVVMSSKGTMIGFVVGVMKILSAIRTRNFNWRIAITDLIGATVFGYTTFEWAASSVVLSQWQVYLVTVFSSLNAFLIMKTFNDPEVFKKIISTWLKSDLSGKGDKHE